MRRPAWIAVGALALACQGVEGEGSTATSTSTLEGTLVDLVEASQWQPLSATDDPFADHRPASFDCTLGLGWLLEGSVLEINTGLCEYGAFGQATLVEIVPGAQLSLNLFHFDLVAPAPASAHVAVQLGEHVIFEREVAIPGKAEVFAIDLVADFALPAGSPVVFHLHNHGQNTWTFASLQVEVESP